MCCRGYLQMGITTISSRELNHDVGKAKKAASTGPVFITYRGEVSHVLLTIEEYQRLSNQTKNIAELLSMSQSLEIELERISEGLYKPVDFS